jgi:site-specific recombinase XerD
MKKKKFKRPSHKKSKKQKKKEYKKANSELMQKFFEDCYANGLSESRVRKYRATLRNLSAIIGKPFTEATKEDLKRAVARIEKSNYSEWTKHDYKVSIKKFWKWLKQTEDFYPEEVRWIKTTIRRVKEKFPEELLTPEEVKKMIESADNIRDKSLISVLYESGCRVGELLAMRMKDVSFEGPACSIRLTGKTGTRRVLLVTSTPYLANWISHSPLRKDPNAFVWISIGTKNHCKRLKYESVRYLLKGAAEKAGINKKVNPHNFRHSRATFLANKLTEAQMCAYLGWVQGSDMPRVYVHLSGRDVDNAILEMHGLKKPDESEKQKEMSIKRCEICGQVNEFEAKICRRCARPLDIESALEIQKKEEKLLSMLSPGIIDELIKARVREILRSQGVNWTDEDLEARLESRKAKKQAGVI